MTWLLALSALPVVGFLGWDLLRHKPPTPKVPQGIMLLPVERFRFDAGGLVLLVGSKAATLTVLMARHCPPGELPSKAGYLLCLSEAISLLEEYIEERPVKTHWSDLHELASEWRVQARFLEATCSNH